jgi:lactoylglutathione lyase
MHIEHVAIWTRDLDRLVAFYVTYLSGEAGLRYQNPRTGFASIFVRFESGAQLEIMQMAGISANANDPMTQATGLIHLAFSVGSQEAVDALTDRLAADGLRVIGAPRTAGDGYYESVILDPDGNRIEITI